MVNNWKSVIPYSNKPDVAYTVQVSDKWSDIMYLYRS